VAALHAAIFRRTGLAEFGVRLQLAAIPCWPVLGLALLLVTRDRTRLWDWFDLCLVTLCIGLAVLAVGGVVNMLGPATWQPDRIVFQVVDILLADLTMAIYFTRRAPALALSAGPAWLLWVVVLNGAFALAWVRLGP